MLVNIAATWSAANPTIVGHDDPKADPGTEVRLAVAAPRPEKLVVRGARISDMRAVEPLIRNFAADNLMLPKSFDQLARTFREFVVVKDESERVLACGSLRIYTEGLAEICSLAVDAPYQGIGIGRMIVERLVEEAGSLAIGKVFALTLELGFFQRLGFHVAPKEDFPLKVWADCRNCPKLHACDEIAMAIDIDVGVDIGIE